MKVLFLCSANKLRSRTAEDFMPLHFPDHEYQSAGTNIRICQKEGTTPVTQELIDWADLVVCMETKHLHQIAKGRPKRVKVLHIKDQWKYGESGLIELLKEKLSGTL